MNFKPWMESSSSDNHFFLDLDQTLVTVRHDEGEKHPGYSRRVQADGAGPGDFIAYLRPHAKEFIKALKAIGDVTILTHGITQYQDIVADALGLDVPVVGRDNYYEVQLSGTPWLVDDTPVSNYRTQLKMRTLGMESDDPHFIHVTKFHPGDTDDRELDKVLAKIQSMLGVQEWVEKIPDVGPSKQPFKTYDKAKREAKEREDIFKEMLKRAGEGHKILVNIKTKSSFKDKTVDRGKDPQKVRDVLRAAILVDRKDQIDGVVEKLKETFPVKKVDHKDKPETEYGYYGAVHVDVLVCGMICEIQVMTKRLWDHKLETDKIYHKYRSKGGAPPEVLERSRRLFRLANNDPRPSSKTAQ